MNIENNTKCNNTLFLNAFLLIDKSASSEISMFTRLDSETASGLTMKFT